MFALSFVSSSITTQTHCLVHGELWDWSCVGGGGWLTKFLFAQEFSRLLGDKALKASFHGQRENVNLSLSVKVWRIPVVVRLFRFSAKIDYSLQSDNHSCYY